MFLVQLLLFGEMDMKAKRFISILLSLCLSLSISGCGAKASVTNYLPELDYYETTDKVTDFFYDMNSDWLYKNQLTDYDLSISKTDTNDILLFSSLSSLISDEKLGTLPKDDPMNKIYSYYNQLLDSSNRETDCIYLQDYLSSIFDYADLEDFLSIMICDPYSLCNPFLEISYTISNGEYVPLITYDPLYSIPGVISEKSYDIMKKYYRSILVQIGFDKNEAYSIVEAAVSLDKSIRENMSGRQYLAEYSYSYVNSLNMKVDIINILNLSGLLCNEPTTYKETAFCCPKGYIRWLNSYFTEKNLYNLKAFYAIKFLEYNIAFTPKEIYGEYMNIWSELGGAKPSKDFDGLYPEEIAISGLLTDNLDALEKYYADHFFGEDIKADSLALSEEIRNEYVALIYDIPWLNKKQKKHLVEKINDIRVHIGCHDNIDDLSYFNIQPSSLASSWSLKFNNLAYMRKMIRQGIDVSSRKTFFQTNAYYAPVSNEIYIMDGYYTSPLNANECSYEEKLAGLGSVIAHEFGHSLDITNIAYDKNNNYDKSFSKGLDEYVDFCNRLCDYYTNTPTSLNNEMDGYKEIEEIISDYLAMEVLIRMLDRKEFADYKKFFSTYAQFQAERMRPEYEELLISYDVHPPIKERVNLTLAQFDKFYQTYGVSKYSPYYVESENRIRLY